MGETLPRIARASAEDFDFHYQGSGNLDMKGALNDAKNSQTWPVLNWKELGLQAKWLAPKLAGLHVDRLIVPDRGYFPQGYLKGEWALRLTGRKEEFCLIFSVRPRHPYVIFLDNKGPRASETGTRSPFDLAATKLLRGLKIQKAEAIHRERTFVIWFEELALVINLIPAAAEALIVSRPDLKIVARSRTIREDSPQFNVPFQFADGAAAPDDLPVRTPWGADATAFRNEIEAKLKSEAFALRIQEVTKVLKENLKLAERRLKQSETALAEARSEANWQIYGDYLKAALSMPQPPKPIPKGKGMVWRVPDFESGEVEIPAELGLNLQEQAEKFYGLARRCSRRLKESQIRIESFSGTVAKLRALIAASPTEWADLEAWERSAGIGPRATDGKAPRKAGKANASKWLGKSFVSRDGLPIWVGRSRDENLELTFKHARGNDLWLHVRGRPGAHVVIPLSSGKTAPLETLLDAATLALYYSGGEKWGKTEVDYAHKKHVKRIRDSTEASYTHNKTLILEISAERMKRLAGTSD